MIDFSCPRCGTAYHADESHLGKRILCTHLQQGKQCGEIVAIARSNRPLPNERERQANGVDVGESYRHRVVQHRTSNWNRGITFACIAAFSLVGIGFGVHHLVAHGDASKPESSPAVNPPSLVNTSDISSRPIISLPNGTELRRRLRLKGHGDLEVENGTPEDAVVHLVELTSQKTTRTFYVQAGMTFTERQISPGLYGVYFSSGTDWDVAKKFFKENASFSQFGKNLDYSETRDEATGEMTFHHREITLQPVVGGEVATYPLSKDAFDKMMDQEADE